MDLIYVAGAVLTAVVSLWGITWKLSSNSEARTLAAMADLKQDLRAEIADVKKELRAEIVGVKEDLKAEIVDVKEDLKHDVATLRTGHADRLTSIEGWARTPAQVTAP